MIDKLNDLKYKTNEWQKTNENIVDQGDSYMRKKRREKTRSKERTDSLVKDKQAHKDKDTRALGYGGRDSSNGKFNEKEKSITDSIQLDQSRSQSPDIIKNDNQSSLISETQILYSEDMPNKSSFSNYNVKVRPGSAISLLSKVSKNSTKSNNKSLNKKLEKSLNNNISQLNQDNLYEYNLIAKSFSSKQLETIKKVLGDTKSNVSKNSVTTISDSNDKAVNSEYERSLAKEIKDLRSALKILETQKTQILKDSEEINKCIGYLSSNPDITESLLLSQMEHNRSAQCEMLNNQVSDILVSSQILTLRESIYKMTQEVEMYESLLASFIKN